MKRVGIIALIVLGVLASLYVAARQYSRAMIYHPNHDVVAPDLPGVSAERIETSDGETLIAWYRAPQPGQPVLLYFDGNAGAPEMWDERWQAIADRGAGFLAVYYRGYSGSTGSPSERGLITDARAGYDWLIAHNYAPRDIVIHGFSLGSAVAVQLAAERPARALILEAPMTGIDDIARPHAPGGYTGFMQDTFRSRDFIPRVAMPVLIAHGEADDVIPIAHGERLFALANAPKHFVRVPRADHADLPREGLYAHIWAFLDSHPAE